MHKYDLNLKKNFEYLRLRVDKGFFFQLPLDFYNIILSSLDSEKRTF